MTVWMLVSKQNIFTDEQLLTHSVLWSSIHHWTFPRFNKIKQEISHYDCFDPKCESLCSKKESPDFSCSEQNLYDFVILMIFLTLWWLYDDVHKTCLVFHVIVNISFSYDILLITTALIQSENHLTVSNHSTFPCSEQNVYERMIPRKTVFTKLACFFHVTVNVSFSYDLFIWK